MRPAPQLRLDALEQGVARITVASAQSSYQPCRGVVVGQFSSTGCCTREISAIELDNASIGLQAPAERSGPGECQPDQDRSDSL